MGSRRMRKAENAEEDMEDTVFLMQGGEGRSFTIKSTDPLLVIDPGGGECQGAGAQWDMEETMNLMQWGEGRSCITGQRRRFSMRSIPALSPDPLLIDRGGGECRGAQKGG